MRCSSSLTSSPNFNNCTMTPMQRKNFMVFLKAVGNANRGSRFALLLAREEDLRLLAFAVASSRASTSVSLVARFATSGAADGLLPATSFDELRMRDIADNGKRRGEGGGGQPRNTSNTRQGTLQNLLPLSSSKLRDLCGLPCLETRAWRKKKKKKKRFFWFCSPLAAPVSWKQRLV